MGFVGTSIGLPLATPVCVGKRNTCCRAHWFGRNGNSTSKIEAGRKKTELHIVEALLGISLVWSPVSDATAAFGIDSSVQNCQNQLCIEERAMQIAGQAPFDLEFPPLPDLALPKYHQSLSNRESGFVLRQFVLKNGLKVVLLEDHEVPTVRGRIYMKGGTYAAANDKVGLPLVAVTLQRGTGTRQLPESQLDDRLDEMAASISSGALGLATTFGFESLKEDTSEVLGMLSSMLRDPQYSDAKLALYRSRLLNSVQHRNDNSSVVARRTLGQVIYGSQSLYARQPTERGAKSLNEEDVNSFFKKWERPDLSVLGLVGDFNAAEMEKTIREKFDMWQPAPGEPEEPPKVVLSEIPPARHKGWIFLVQESSATQASVAMGELGVSLEDPNSPALDVLSSVFNSYGGRLFDQIRSRDGLAYSIEAKWQMPTDYPGLFVLEGSTTLPVEFVKGVTRQLEMATEMNPSDLELDRARSEAVNSFVFNFASTGALINRSLIYDLVGLPQDFLFKYKSSLEKVTGDDVLNAAKSYLHPHEQVIVIVGDVNQYKEDFKALGYRVESYQPV